MLKGVHLTLLIGPAVPVPAPQVGDRALDERAGDERQRQRSGFQLTFARRQELAAADDDASAGGYFDPMITRVIIIVDASTACRTC